MATLRERLAVVLTRMKSVLGPVVNCQKCGRVLTNAASIERGMGSCCAKKKVRDDRTIDMFEYSANPPGLVMSDAAFDKLTGGQAR